jgi:hypothetical protein
MLLQTNSYIVPKEKRVEHARLLQRFRHALAKLGCDQFECYEQTGTNWAGGESSNRFVQIMRFRDRKHQLAVQEAERKDPTAQNLIKEFCELINFPYQQQQGYFAVGFYTSVLPVAALRIASNNEPETAASAPTSDSSPELTLASDAPIEGDLGEFTEEPTLDLDEEAAADLLNPSPNSDVATADFGDVLELDDLADEKSQPHSTSKKPPA